MTIRDDVTYFIYEHGWSCVLFKKEDNRHCMCTMSKTHGGNYNEPDKNCPVCHGRGLYGIQKLIKVRDVQSLAKQERAFWGEIADDERVLYMTYDVQPSLQDEIWEILLDASGKAIVPIKIIQVFNIVSVRPMRGEGGQLSYYAIKIKRTA